MARSAVFLVQLSRPSSQTVSVNYTTVAGTATAGSDFTPVSGTVTFSPGQTSAQVVVPIQDPRAVGQPKEAFTLVLSSPVNATIADGTGNGYVPAQNPTRYPVVSVADASGYTTIPFIVSLTEAHTIECSIGYSCKSITAIAGQDYTPVSGTLTFAIGETSKTVNVTALAKCDKELTLRLVLASPVKVTLLKLKTGVGKITPDPTVVSLMAIEASAKTAYKTAEAALVASKEVYDKAWSEWDIASRFYQQAVDARISAEAEVNAAASQVSYLEGEESRWVGIAAMYPLGGVGLADVQSKLANARSRRTAADAALTAASSAEATALSDKNTKYAAQSSAKSDWYDVKRPLASQALAAWILAFNNAKAAFVGSVKHAEWDINA